MPQDDFVRSRMCLSEERALKARVTELEALIGSPHNEDWLEGVRIEAAHQRERWANAHDAGKTPFDWFWLIGYLAQKAATSAVGADAEKAKHHTISTGAALLNWHRQIAGLDGDMRPGIGPGSAAYPHALSADTTPETPHG